MTEVMMVGDTTLKQLGDRLLTDPHPYQVRRAVLLLLVAGPYVRALNEDELRALASEEHLPLDALLRARALIIDRLEFEFTE
ncbi:hypothetical protein DL240_09235 [Lujinxingia litoralis]|uniref:Uncharacterized protein n=1 Tax=Lujinxingia litoralis TaxID=2211119 RepID=A0A328C6B8_9DELT|nr:hypothetical protein [Lujinxingia litoralis]RAL23059.1 hypothetical protein DL240_09235 [Lujinxingia litoralis]